MSVIYVYLPRYFGQNFAHNIFQMSLVVFVKYYNRWENMCWLQTVNVGS